MHVRSWSSGWTAAVRRVCLCAAVLGWAMWASSGWAQTPPVVPELRRESEGLLLSARLPLETPDGLEDVLLRGVPVQFIWQAEVRRSRWYWTDQRLVSAQRVVRLAYQPLTRRWRVSVSSGAAMQAGLAGALHQNLDSFSEALAAATAVSGWRIAEANELPPRDDLRLDLQFRLDGGLLPRPFQLGRGEEGHWGMTYRTTVPVPPATPEAGAE